MTGLDASVPVRDLGRERALPDPLRLAGRGVTQPRAARHPRPETARRACLTILILVAALPAQARDPWTAADSALEAAGATLQLLDWSQSLYLAHGGPIAHGHEGQESNPVLGSHPSYAEVNAYFAATLAGHLAIAYVLPRPWRTLWQVLLIGVEGDSVVHNMNIGARVALP